jgi:glycosyltransferase involved in cell wall biosynthesis
VTVFPLRQGCPAQQSPWERPVSVRILLANKFAHVTGGADKHCLDLAGLLSAAGHDVRMFSTVSSDNQEVAGAFISCTVSNSTRDHLPAGQRGATFLKSLWNPEASREMKRLILNFKPDIVHAHKLYPQLSVAPLLTAARMGIPIVQTLHDYEMVAANAFDSSGRWVDHGENRWDYRFLNTATHGIRRTVHRRLITRWIAVSNFVSDVHSRAGISADVLPNFVESDPPGLTFDRRVGVAFVGRLSAEKGVRCVVELARRRPDLPVTIAGGGEMSDEVQRASRELPNLSAPGRLDRSEVRELLVRSRVALMPSLWDEPGPLVALEAMAAGTPIVAYRRGGLAEYVANAKCGSVVPSDIDAMGSEAARFHTVRADWETASTSGLRAVATTHSPAAYVDGLQAIYRATPTRSAHG